jgi:hypothetical protein
MAEADRLSAKFEDLLFSIRLRGQFWRVQVEIIGDPDSALSGGQDYPTLARAKEGARSLALELFGTAVTGPDLNWEPTDLRYD